MGQNGGSKVEEQPKEAEIVQEEQAPMGALFFSGNADQVQGQNGDGKQQSVSAQDNNTENLDVVEPLSLKQQENSLSRHEAKNKISTAFITNDVDFDDVVDPDIAQSSMNTNAVTSAQDVLFKRDLFTRNFEHEAKNAELFVQLSRE